MHVRDERWSGLTIRQTIRAARVGPSERKKHANPSQNVVTAIFDLLAALYAKRHEESLFGSSASNKMQLPGHHDAAASIGTRPPLHEDCVGPNDYHVLLALCCQLENAILLKNAKILSGVCQVEVDV